MDPKKSKDREKKRIIDQFINWNYKKFIFEGIIYPLIYVPLFMFLKNIFGSSLTIPTGLYFIILFTLIILPLAIIANYIVSNYSSILSITKEVFLSIFLLVSLVTNWIIYREFVFEDEEEGYIITGTSVSQWCMDKIDNAKGLTNFFYWEECGYDQYRIWNNTKLVEYSFFLVCFLSAFAISLFLINNLKPLFIKENIT